LFSLSLFLREIGGLIRASISHQQAKAAAKRERHSISHSSFIVEEA
jgi:hypothetical protein